MKHVIALSLLVHTGLVLCGCPTPVPLPPIADFIATPRTGQAPLNVTFTDISNPGNSAIIQWHWDFGDGVDVAGTPTAIHTFLEPGEYSVSLQVSNASGTDQEIKQSYVIVARAVPITFGDPDVEAHVRAVSGVFNRPLYPADLLEVRVLVLPDTIVSSLEGLQGCVNLRELKCRHSGSISLTPLSGLAHLESLDLIGTLVSSRLEGLGGMTSLKRLYLNNCSIDISLAAPVLSSLTGLEILWLQNNRNANTLSFLSTMPQLRELDLARCEPTSLTALAGRKNLEWLSIYTDYTLELSPLATLTNLRELYLHTGFIDVDSLSDLVKLKVLSLGNNNISQINGLSGMLLLEELRMGSNQIDDVTALNGLVNLKILDLSYNEITEIGPISSLRRLEEIDISNNQINSVSALGSATSLLRVDISTNLISDLSSLESLVEIQDLFATSNQIMNVSAIAALVNLRQLGLADNSITDFQPLLDNQGLGAGDKINISENAISQEEFCALYFAFDARDVEFSGGPQICN